MSIKKYLDIVREENKLDDGVAKKILRNILEVLRSLKKKQESCKNK